MEFRRFGVNSTSARRMDRAYTHSVSGGAGGRGIRISTGHSALVGSSFGGGYDYLSSSFGSASGTLGITNEKTTMQHLNDRLANYLETVRSLEKANGILEIKIRETIEKKGPLEGRDYSKYEATITELRANIFALMKDTGYLVIDRDNTSLASEDFRMKMEYEMSLRQTVEADVAGLRKLLDDINIVRMHLEGDIESLKEELIYLRKNHETDVAELQAQITEVGVRVDIDAPKGQDLTQIMDEMRAKYEKITLKNQEDLKAWHETQITEVQVQVTESSTALKEATAEVSESRRTYQKLEIEMESALILKASLEATLRDIEMCYNTEVEKYNVVILRLQEELTHIRSDIQHNTTEYERLLNIKGKLEAEICEYRRLLDGEASFTLEEAVKSKLVQTKVVTVTQTLVDGKVVSESKDVQSSSAVAAY
ncbi:keratin, type I cytoskeletal 18-like [Pseudoliparis swirei]|uniref:keratin, type I cytoskeletal 18-like n=1 Tax=Pseudoliparis swirei TaxID=2059687 RepID=UPI0024BDE432|nr:keratin, type I cytoskeletal 18-like [Pseudoliparis swirei]